VRSRSPSRSIIAVAGTLYSVILGFLTVVAWQHFADARTLVATEAAAAADIWHVTVGLPETRSRRIRTDILNYSQLMADREWPAMRTGEYYREADFILMDAMAAVSSYNPRDYKEVSAQSATISQLSDLHDVRQRRLSENEAGIARFEWIVLAVGGIGIIC
jgi:hypothetical protein